MRRGEAFLERAQSAQEHWEAITAKVNPALPEMAWLFKECTEAAEPLYKFRSRELLAPIEAKMEKGLAEIHRRFSGPVQPPKNTFPCEVIFPPESKESEGLAMAAFLHWERHKIPLARDVKRMEEKDGEAVRRVLRTVGDYEAIRCDRKRPKPFKGKIDHSNIFGFGLGLGLEKLTAEELAVFFDRFCPSCRDAHNPDALRRQRAEFLKALQGARESTPAG